jgi:diguanylate cyclase (GGDEF)-like protein
LFISAFNLFLLVPDLINLQGQTVWPIIVIRAVYSTALLSSLIWVGKTKDFFLRSVLVTMFEIAAILIFLFVFSLYPEPDFFIQMLGVMAIIMVTFVIPNMWLLAVGVSVVSAVAFLALARVQIVFLQSGHFFAGLVYLIFEIAVGAIFAMLFKRYQYREFVAKTELERIYSTDPLTKIGNRIKLEEEAEKWLTCCEKDNLPLCMVLMDVDNLKHINDSHGHLVGDTVLYETAQILRANLRDHDVCVRWGGDEFVLLLPCVSASAAHQLAVRIRDAVTSYEFSARIDVSCSFGITQMQRGQSLEQLIAQADKSMYRAKEKGKNTIEVSDGIHA